MTEPPPPHEEAGDANDEQEADDLSAQASPAAAPSRPLWDTLWQGQAMAAARRRLEDAYEASGPDLQRAESALAHGLRILDPADPLPSGPAPHLATLLLREAAYWALRSLQVSGASLSAQLAKVPAPILAFAAGGEDHADRARDLLLRDARLDATRPVEEVELEAQELARIVRGFLDCSRGPQEEIARIQASRVFRLGGVALGVLALIGALVWGGTRFVQPPDLLPGKPWRASSAYKNFNVGAHQVDGNSTQVFFHTNEETNAWIEFDLQKPTQFRSVTLKNRTDCCSERAVPLVIESSDDRNHWTELARKSDDFRSWTAKFAPKTARYVRIRTLKRTWLHLEGVNVR